MYSIIRRIYWLHMFRIQLIVFYPKQISSSNFPFSLNGKNKSLKASTRYVPLEKPFWRLLGSHTPGHRSSSSCFRMWNPHRQSHFTELRNCTHKPYVKVHPAFLEKTFIKAKAYQELRVTRIHLVDPQCLVVLLLLRLMMMITVRTAGIFLWKALSKAASWHPGLEDRSIPGELCFHRHPASTRSKPLGSMDPRTKNESRRSSNFPESTDPGSNRVTPRSDSGNTRETTPHFAFTPENCRRKLTSPTSQFNQRSSSINCQIHPFSLWIPIATPRTCYRHSALISTFSHAFWAFCLCKALFSSVYSFAVFFVFVFIFVFVLLS